MCLGLGHTMQVDARIDRRTAASKLLLFPSHNWSQRWWRWVALACGWGLKIGWRSFVRGARHVSDTSFVSRCRHLLLALPQRSDGTCNERPQMLFLRRQSSAAERSYQLRDRLSAAHWL